MQKIERVAVLGAGTMGSRIAAHFANAGFPVLLLDLPSPDDRNAIARAGLEAALKQRPSAFFVPSNAALIETGNFDDHLKHIRECQWIVEAVKEDLGVKRALWSRVDRFAAPDAILSTNTSGIPISEISSGFAHSFRRRFLGTHFFNPPRYLHLLEIVPGPDTSTAILDSVRDFGQRALGKGIVVAKDTPNFIANRMGAFYSVAIQRAMVEAGFSIEEADALSGPLLGMPKSAAFRLIDIIGLDVWAGVLDNVYTRTRDRWREWFALQPFIREMLHRGWLGEKAGQGFYKRENGRILAIDWRTFAYHPAQPPSWPQVEAARKLPLGERLRNLMDTQDRIGAFIRSVLTNVFTYAVEMVPEISDRIVEIDRAMRWGFAHKLGPFELWDEIGFDYIAARIEPRTPASIRRMQPHSFYRPGEYFDLVRNAWQPLEQRPGLISIRDIKRERGELASNEEASLLDLGERVLCLEFHSKMNAIGEHAIETMRRAVELLERFDGLLIANEGENFSAGANLSFMLALAKAGEFPRLERFIANFQNALLALKYAPKPVVSAPFNHTLGGGCEVVLHSRRVQASAECYIGLVERNVGLIPGGGGTKELALRFADPLKGLDLLAKAAATSSAAEARELGLLQPADRISMNPECLIGDGLRLVVELSQIYEPGEPKKDVVVSGYSGFEKMRQYLLASKDAGAITAHDFTILENAARVLSGGPSASGMISESELLDLERQHFMALIRTPQTQQRMAHMLEHGKPLKN
jgi:3-hydroxyacyl-CoA dehydrogenase